MKFLAVFKDSLREAIDSKVFYVMVGLSSLLILLALTLSFEPQPALEFMKFMVLPLNADMSSLGPKAFEQMGGRTFAGSNSYDVKSAKPKEGFSEGPGSDYVVTIVARFAKDEEYQKARQDSGEIEERIKQRFGAFDEMKAVDVRSVRLADAEPSETAAGNSKQLFFEVDTGPTKVTRRLWPHQPSLFFGSVPMPFLKEVPLGLQLYGIEDAVINRVGAWVAILVSIVITSFFIPNMLRKGTVDLLLVKPISRPVLLIFKFLGGLLFIFLNTAFIVLGMWLAVGLQSGIWAWGTLLTVFINTYFFAILYSVSCLFGVLTRSPIVAILISCVTWAFLFGVGVAYEAIPPKVDSQSTPSAEMFYSSIRAIHFVLPRTQDLTTLTTRLLMEDFLTGNQVRFEKVDTTPISWGESLTVSAIFIALMLGLSCWRFTTTDY
jgi:ABC-type transport system involved in multi-copper enzyme maturation permease subunit